MDRRVCRYFVVFLFIGISAVVFIDNLPVFGNKETAAVIVTVKMLVVKTLHISFIVRSIFGRDFR